MIWLKNLLFLAVIGGGATALVVELWPARLAKPAPVAHSSEVDATIAKVDESFRQRWEAQGLKPSAIADDTLIARRLALGLMGTVPSVEELRQFESLPKEQRIDWYLERILADRRCHDHLAERFARATVGTEDGPFIFYRRRRFTSWLADEIGANAPYDRIVRAMIAGTGLWTDHPATNFITVTTQQDKKNAPDPVRLAGRVTRAFLGLRIDCAECHNHPFASWKQDDFESLSAFFAQTHLGFQGIRDGTGEYAIDDKKKDVRRIVRAAVPFAPELLPEDGPLRERLAVWVTHPRNPYFARAAVNRMWAILCGRPLIDPVDNLEPQDATNDHPAKEALAILADDFAAHGYDLRRLIRIIVGTKAFRFDSRSADPMSNAEEHWAVFPLTRLRPDQVAGGLLQAASLRTLDADTNILWRTVKLLQQADFVKRYGDTGGDDEFDGRGGTIPQRLLLMNGKLVHDKIDKNPLNSAARIAWQLRDDATAVEVAFLATLTRRPSDAEKEYFTKMLADPTLSRTQKLEDLFWALVNSTEFSWNH